MTACRLVLLPGMDGTGLLFEPFLAALGADVATTVVDYASPEVFEYAECRAVAERKLPQDGSYVLVGESFSGPIAVSIAATRPPGLRGIVLVGSFVASPTQGLRWLTPFASLLPMHEPGWARDSLLLGPHATPDIRLRLQRAITSVTPRTLRGRLRQIARVNVARELTTLDVPILYLRANGDRVVPTTCADEIARLAWSVRIADVHAPHMMLQCAPAECAALIRDFARECAA